MILSTFMDSVVFPLRCFLSMRPARRMRCYYCLQLLVCSLVNTPLLILCTALTCLVCTMEGQKLIFLLTTPITHKIFKCVKKRECSYRKWNRIQFNVTVSNWWNWRSCIIIKIIYLQMTLPCQLYNFVMMFLYPHERKLILKFRKPKRLTGLEVHQDGVKRGNSLE